MTTLIEQPRTRIDGPAKVCGRALYSSDEAVKIPAWAFLVTSTIARGRIERFDLAEARAMPGVIDILTHETVGGEAKPPRQQSGGETTTTMESDRIWHDGQIIGVVLANSYEIARGAAFRVRVDYAPEEPSATFGLPGAEEEVRDDGEHHDYGVGDAEAALANADAAPQPDRAVRHHRRMERGKLTIWEPSQFVYGLRGNVAEQIGIDPTDLHVMSKFVGGSFGSRGGATARTAWIAIATRRIGRPVKLVATRDQGFTIATYRAEPRHHLQLGATRDGKLTALRHEGWELTSRPSSYNVSGTDTTARMYGYPKHPHQGEHRPCRPQHAGLHARTARYAVSVPARMRDRRTRRAARHRSGRAEAAQRHADRSRHRPALLEPSSDRLSRPGGRAVRLGRARSDAGRDARRRLADRLGLRVGGLSIEHRVDRSARNAARRRPLPDRAGRQDIGTGAYTVTAITAAHNLGLEVEQVAVHMGDTTLPPASLAAGSSHTATITHARGTQREDVTAYAFGAQFVEVRVHRLTCEIRVPRMVGASASGTIVNPLTAHSQYMGGMIWGLGAALEEKTEIDRVHARYVNDNLSEYHFRVNADLASVEVIMVPEQDAAVNPLGIKGIGEIGIVGMNAAIANAVYHATGRRIRRLPIRIDDLL